MKRALAFVACVSTHCQGVWGFLPRGGFYVLILYRNSHLQLSIANCMYFILNRIILIRIIKEPVPLAAYCTQSLAVRLLGGVKTPFVATDGCCSHRVRGRRQNRQVHPRQVHPRWKEVCLPRCLPAGVLGGEVSSKKEAGLGLLLSFRSYKVPR